MKKTMIKIKDYIKNMKIEDYIRTLLYLLIMVLLIRYFDIKLFGILVLISLIVVGFIMYRNSLFISRASGNVIIYGGRGKGKGMLLNYKIKKDKTKPYVNVPYFKTLDKKRNVIIDGLTLKETKYTGKEKYHCVLLNEIGDYLNSIEPLEIEDFINGTVVPVKKRDYEKRNVYIDDVNIYMPNWADSLLKKKYKSMPPFLAINRQLYNAYCVITTQDRERPYKVLKELQSDGSIKALNTVGFGRLWNCVPFLHFFVRTKYIYHELSTSQDKLPFAGRGVINEATKSAYLTSGQATKELYEASFGKIRYGYVWQLKSRINYDTRYYHTVVYGEKSP